FPDVAVFSLLVLPHQPDTLWAGTEIGLFVSENAGQTWEIADNGLPPVAIFQISAVEDQILLATQGRGLWTLQVPELLNLPKPAYVLSPRLLDVGMHANGSWHAVVEMRDLYTETQLLVNGEPFQTWPANFAPGRVDVWGPVTAPQNLTLQVQSTLDQKVLASAPQSVSVFSNASQGDGTLSFEASQTNQDWQTSGLNFGTLSGFSGRGLQSPHPYSAGQNLIAQLKRPVVVAEEETRFSYRDVALLEPGDSGSVFGSGSFYDFVVVEASEDGVTWLPVVDGYDATFDPTWLSLYQSSGSPNSSHLRSHSFNLNDFFAVGHQVFVRWRLYADPGVNGWGWWISDIALQRNGQAQMVQSELLFPWMSHSSDFDSLLVLVNPQDSEMQVQLKGRRSQGPSFTQTISLPAWGSAAQPLDSLFPNLEQGSGLTVTASSASPNLKGSWVTYQTERGSGLSPAFGEAVSVLVDRPDRERMGRTLLAGYFPAFSDQVAACVIAQPALRQGGIQAEMRDSLGTALPLPSPFSSPNAYRPNAALVDPATQAEVQWLLSGADPFCGVGFVFNSFNEPAIGMLQPLDRLMFDSDSSEFVLPWVSQNQRFQSQVIINNVGREPASVHLIARRGDGTTAETDRTVPSMGFLSESAANLFPTLDDGPGFCVQVMGDKPGLVGRWVTFQLEAPSGHSPSQGTSIDRKIRAVDTSAGSHLLFTFLPVANGFISAPVLVNLANEPADISLSFRNQQGQIVFTDSVAGLMPMTPFARALPNWVPQDQGDLILEVQATQRICGVGFVFNASAEPAIGLAQALAP
ncbi:MAG: hypothetical protein KDC71_20210, partial [Acidobacteria bacterium]|nr:hypothetical protein [Acidobacteriota bacterium]